MTSDREMNKTASKKCVWRGKAFSSMNVEKAHKLSLIHI